MRHNFKLLDYHFGFCEKNVEFTPSSVHCRYGQYSMFDGSPGPTADNVSEDDNPALCTAMFYRPVYCKYKCYI